MCITENKTKVLRLTFAFFFYFSLFLSITPKVMNMEISSKISQELLDLGF